MPPELAHFLDSIFKENSGFNVVYSLYVSNKHEKSLIHKGSNFGYLIFLQIKSANVTKLSVYCQTASADRMFPLSSAV